MSDLIPDEELQDIVLERQVHSRREFVARRVSPVTREALIEAIANRLSWPSLHWEFSDPDMHRAVADAILAEFPLSVSPPAEVTDEMVERAARRMAQLDLPDSHTLDERLTAPWQRYKYEAEQVLEAALTLVTPGEGKEQ